MPYYSTSRLCYEHDVYRTKKLKSAHIPACRVLCTSSTLWSGILPIFNGPGSDSMALSHMCRWVFLSGWGMGSFPVRLSNVYSLSQWSFALRRHPTARMSRYHSICWVSCSKFLDSKRPHSEWPYVPKLSQSDGLTAAVTANRPDDLSVHLVAPVSAFIISCLVEDRMTL